jgi:diadenosine tetraphosphate (Ap4A) HIT family hydrolase
VSSCSFQRRDQLPVDGTRARSRSRHEYADCFRLVRTLKQLVLARLAPDGFNVGANCGEAGGQSVWHAHIHVIPRYRGDVADPRGGVRHVIPLKASY